MSKAHGEQNRDSRIPALLLSTMKCLILVAILLSVGLAHGYNCPEEGIHFDDDTIDCNMTVDSWEDCGAICELMVDCLFWSWKIETKECCAKFDCLFWSWKIETKECCAKFDDSIVEPNDKFISGDLGCK